jgi:nucleoside-triphosphatase THEP1
VVVIDEVGKMELASAAFGGAMQRLLDTGCSLVGTVHTHRHPFSDARKRRIQVVQPDAGNRTCSRCSLRTVSPRIPPLAEKALCDGVAAS